MSLKCVLQKNIFMHSHTQKKSTFRQQQGLDLGYLTQKMQIFPLFLICRDWAENTTKSIHKKKTLSTLFLICRDRKECKKREYKLERLTMKKK
jgi:uncharacterized membrane protein